MFKKLIVILALLAIVSWAGGYVILRHSPPYAALTRKGKSFAKKIAGYASSIIYREATSHNPSGDVVPDGIDDKVKQEIKEAF